MRIITVNGRIGGDVVRQVSKQGTQYISFSLANNEFGDPKSADGSPQAQWFRVTSFQPQHMALAQYLKKGKPINVVGKYSNRLYQNQNTGQWNISNDIVAMSIDFENGTEHSDNNNSNKIANDTHVQQVTNNYQTNSEEIPQVTYKNMEQTPSPQVTSSTVQLSSSTEMDDLPF